jgi:phosphatidylserine/phosphatidylglycerophosphate/cardiolipin synthase-like enzyme
MDAWLKGEPPAPEVVREIERRRLPWLEELAKYPRLRGIAAKAVSHVVRAAARLLDSRTRLQAKVDAIGQALLRLTRSAREHILIQSPYLVLSEDGVRVLEEAGRRGVRLTILTNSPLSSDNALSQAFFLEQWPELLARIPGLRIFVSGETRTLHSKLMIFDDRVTVVGTYNLDPISMAINSEIMAAVWSEEFARTAASQPHWLMNTGAPTVYEYRIRRDARGRALRGVDGKPLVAFGPQHHSSPQKWKQVQVYWQLLQAADQLPGFSPIF